ncbi:methylated-DNA--[protein]-cysteine S-methyltransferase [Stappia taiwanensis]|uniref:Methylated-DNA--protein-cysteine methyltransferase n=1 Tax=Stappia taiwanensis TaxID=992267 RepID=A0A838XUU8_9HYPH|nr:methylated-DNA--[protein]-cysteine S-methyltransferase [Stappia taiwanensis]MBA4612388.1 methylated-DNA--[protein]-cysteine S-methyltransferase [Stappia taiwanensis]GGF04963.1 methylated-DNA--protein-cysteine methyltransferase [Stappia taiwanensis]
MPVAHLETSVGLLEVEARDGAIVRLGWERTGEGRSSPLLEAALSQLERYFAGTLREFDLPLAPAGGAFQQQVHAAMLAIPYGETRSYGEIARELGSYGQPVGRACGANPIPIIIPCHRVLSANGLGGYSGDGGTDTKIALLRHEGGYPFLL